VSCFFLCNLLFFAFGGYFFRFYFLCYFVLLPGFRSCAPKKKKKKKKKSEKSLFSFFFFFFFFFAVFAFTLLAIVGVATATKSIVHVVDKDDLSTVGTRFVFTPPVPGVTSVAAISKCHSVVVRDGSSESDSTTSAGFGFDESYFRAHGWRLCTPFELVTISGLIKLPAGKYPTQSIADDDEISELTVNSDGQMSALRAVGFVDNAAYDTRDQIAVCCSGAQFDQVGEGHD
jgi:hypothetical protein